MSPPADIRRIAAALLIRARLFLLVRMNPSTIEVLLFLGGVALTVLGWFARTLHSDQKVTKEEVNNLHIKVVEQYVSNNRFESVLSQINANIERVLNKLDEKADKH